MADEATTRGAEAERDRRSQVLDAALVTFTRFGFRKTSMDDIAAAARISRPGLYFLFSSKHELFVAAVERAIERDLTAADRSLSSTDGDAVDRIVDAFDAWTGRYIGPLSDLHDLVGADPDAVSPGVSAAPAQFDRMLVEALRDTRSPRDARALARVLISVSIGLKHQTHDRRMYLSRMREAAQILLGDG